MLIDSAQTHDVCGVHDDEAQERHVDEVASPEEVLRAIGWVAELTYPARVEFAPEALLQVLMVPWSCDDGDAACEAADAGVPRSPVGIRWPLDLVTCEGEEVDGVSCVAEVVEVALALCDAGVLHITHIDEVRRTVFAGHSEASRDEISTLHTDRVEVATPRDETVEMDLIIATTARAGGDDLARGDEGGGAQGVALLVDGT